MFLSTLLSVFVNFDDTTNPDGILPLFILQCIIVLVLVRVVGKAVGYLRSPPVIGEMVAGIMIGPSVLGNIPGWTNTLFPLSTITYFGLVANVGLIFFMFYLGLELDENLLKKQWKRSVPIAIAAIIVPFGIGALLSLWLYDLNSENFVSVNYTAFVLFCGISISITAFPVLASILTATKLITAPIGVQALSCSAIDDVTAWCLLALCTAFAKSSNPLQAVWTLLLALGFILSAFLFLRPQLDKIYVRWLAQHPNPDLEKSKEFIFLIFIMLLVFCFICEEIGIHSFFGAFTAGLIVPKTNKLHATIAEHLDILTREIFIPLYFANSGIKTNIGTLDSIFWWGVVLAVWVIASVAKFIPATLTAKLVTDRDWRFCVSLGILMNTRGLVELIALNIGLTTGVLSPRIFTILVIMALLTTFTTSPLIWLIYQREYQPELERTRSERMSEVRQMPDQVVDEEKQADQVVQFHNQETIQEELEGMQGGSVKSLSIKSPI